MKFNFTILFLITSYCFSQNNVSELKFDTNYFDAVDNWVAFPKKENDSMYPYGFIYIDSEAGFTFNYESEFKITKERLESKRKDTTRFVKYRLGPEINFVAVLNEKQKKDLKLPDRPDWLKFYKEDSTTVEYLKNIGYFYNDAGAFRLAIEPLLKAYEKDPYYEGLIFELAYSYNALNEFTKAISILENALSTDPENYLYYRELGYAYINTNQIEKAEEIYLKGIELSDNEFQNSEMAVNMASAYFEIRNRKKFDKWARLTKKFAEKDSEYYKFIKQFEKEW